MEFLGTFLDSDSVSIILKNWSQSIVVSVGLATSVGGEIWDQNFEKKVKAQKI